MNFNFKLYNNADHICDFMLGDRLWIPKTDYPDYYDWVSKIHSQFKNQEKFSYCCFVDNKIVGSLTFQPHKTLSGYLEFKNMTINPDVRNRYIASFLMRNGEIEGQKMFGSKFAIADAKADNTSVLMFLLFHKYSLLKTDNLYHYSNKIDNVFVKQLYKKYEST